MSKPLNKKEFIEAVKASAKYETTAEAEKAVNTFMEVVIQEMKKGGGVQLIGFGTFSTKQVAEKSGKIPNSDKQYTKPAHTAPSFKFGKTVKDALN